ncbi:flagellar biogenesis protein FliO [Polymorphobacter multimanifer]|uniref:Flagellar biogenesis protein FliO n=1 Tax=Polymorphobacter multimanifer TaxID=1070431 RepID=A0A841L1Z4_9SPHN|nr:flagellar biosynthetic protein FliO [Polymorphobacter multimanifer]MBB6226336.1 flagellar biogenesis protein FliO [Polymorphobacter multimanifer]
MMALAVWRARLTGMVKAADARRHARVVQLLPLGPGSRLLVVEFGGRRLLLGQGRGALVRLAEADLASAAVEPIT